MIELIAPPQTIVKRDGRVVPFDPQRIDNAIIKCFSGLGKKPLYGLSQQVVNILSAQNQNPTVEDVQDIVEMVLQSIGEYDAAKAYILYRHEHAKQRKERPIPDSVKQSFEEDKLYFPTVTQAFTFYDKYSRFNYDLGRRETWVETVDRAVSFLQELSNFRLLPEVYERIRHGILQMQATPSMRLLAMAGEAARRQNLAIYNCSAVAVSSTDAFVEALIISMAGCGVGFSVESKFVDELPRVKKQIDSTPASFVIPDTTEGWADALRFGLSRWFNGLDVSFDYSQLRPAGTPLKIKGGRSSGAGPFRSALTAIRTKMLARQGSFLRPIDAHDIMCLVGNAAVSGGVRRTAMISLFDYDDSEMLNSKRGNFSQDNNQRWNANNSFVWPEHGMSQLEFSTAFLDMVKSGNGEPGIFSRIAANNTIPARRKKAEFLTNPCAEIFLRDMELCNLSIAVARQSDDMYSLKDKVELATIIGTIQSMATHFPGLRSKWRENSEEERLLGVDINGQMDSGAAMDEGVQRMLREHALITNLEYSKLLGINQSAAVTCVKPSGNSSQLFNCSSGIHTRWSPYYLRNMRVSAHSPIYKVFKDFNVPMSPENGQTEKDATTFVVHFPIKAPDHAVTRKDRNALEQCRYWLQTKTNWTEHNPSVTITYKQDEVIDLMKWVWEHQSVLGGMSFLPVDDAKYDNMPYVEITEVEYERLYGEFPVIDFSKIYRYEEDDLTTAAMENGCVNGLCEISFEERLGAKTKQISTEQN